MAIAQVHAESWRRTYRGILRDDYLDGNVVADKRTLWKNRLSVSAHPERPFVTVIERDGLVAGFVCVFLDSDPEWGALLDNIHVEAKFAGQGYGSKLMACAAAWVASRRPLSRLHLWVYERNVEARRFYERLGGEFVNIHAEPAPDGTRVDAVRYGWRTLSNLAGATAVAQR
jgi:ribosomal protein S18 acetylase RimI-like enzyme